MSYKKNLIRVCLSKKMLTSGVALLCSSQLMAEDKLIASFETSYKDVKKMQNVASFADVGTIRVGKMQGKLSFVADVKKGKGDYDGIVVKKFRGMTKFLSLGRYAGGTSLLAWDFDLSEAKKKENKNYTIKINYSNANADKVKEMAMYASFKGKYKLVEKKLDSRKLPVDKHSGKINETFVKDGRYLTIGELKPSAEEKVYTYDLTQIINNSKDGKVRLLMTVKSFNGTLIIKEGSGIYQSN